MKPPKTIAFFNNKSEVGKTTIVYHLAWMMKERGRRVLAVDLDPQTNLTAAFLSEDAMARRLWPEGQVPRTILGAVQPLLDQGGDVSQPDVWPIDADEFFSVTLGLVAGDLGLSAFEDRLAGHEAFRVTTAFYRAIVRAAEEISADVALIDMGSNLGALNRASLIAADFVVIPMTADLFSLRGLRNLGPALREWREEWRHRLEQESPQDLIIPSGAMRPIGYVLQPAGRERSPSQAFQYWIDKFPGEYRRSVLGLSDGGSDTPEHLLGTLKNHLSLMPLAQQARKPVFALRAADGALGSHAVAAKASYGEFAFLARKIEDACGLLRE